MDSWYTQMCAQQINFILRKVVNELAMVLPTNEEVACSIAFKNSAATFNNRHLAWFLYSWWHCNSINTHNMQTSLRTDINKRHTNDIEHFAVTLTTVIFPTSYTCIWPCITRFQESDLQYVSLSPWCCSESIVAHWQGITIFHPLYCDCLWSSNYFTE